MQPCQGGTRKNRVAEEVYKIFANFFWIPVWVVSILNTCWPNSSGKSVLQLFQNFFEKSKKNRLTIRKGLGIINLSLQKVKNDRCHEANVHWKQNRAGSQGLLFNDVVSGFQNMQICGQQCPQRFTSRDAGGVCNHKQRQFDEFFSRARGQPLAESKR